MASTARTEEQCKEYFDAPDVFERKIDQLVAWVRASKHMIAFTGAGISTSAGIPDFRSGLNTVLETGAGAWTLRAAMAEDASSALLKQNLAKQRALKVGTLNAIPTPTHMALVELQKQGYLKFLISQNTDGLHRRSGFPPEHLAELHGNSNLEQCESCHKEYLRDFHCRARNIGVHEHRTGRHCASCNGFLRDTIINFGESLPEKPLTEAFGNSDDADLCLAMGSSLTVLSHCCCDAYV